VATNDIIHVRPILDEISRIFETELKTPLSLNAVIQGDLSFQPTAGIPNLVNGIWIHPVQMTNQSNEIPRGLQQVYQFRIVYLRRIALNANPMDQILDDVKLIINTLTDNYHLPSIAGLPAHAQIYWAHVDNLEFDPQEDEYVARMAADIKAVAFQLSVVVRTRRA
jgi:hypothetical protein